MLVLFNVFEDWNEEYIVPHISFVSFELIIVNQYIQPIRFEIRMNSNRNACVDSYSIRTQMADSQVSTTHT